MPIQDYVNKVKKRFDSGISTEHSYRGDLQNLLQSLTKGYTITNEPKRQHCGAPDYIIQLKEVPIGYIEAKDIGENLHVLKKSDLEQRNRYLASLDNIIFTDYLEFQFFRYGQKVKEIKIASIENNKVKPIKENYDSFITHINDFCSFKGQTIKSSEKLAKMMAQKARMMEEVIYNAVKIDEGDNTLKDQLKAFKLILIHDLDEKTFADIYAQTIAYGLFAARLHDETLEDFSRQEARELIPRSNPFLRNLFDYISGAQLDDRVVWIVNDLADIFRATDVKALMDDFGKSTQQNDPFLHFYETFLGEYDPKLRKSRGVYYTPEPVVNFIVRAVDDILKSEFNIVDGLADTSKVKIKRVAVGYGKKKGADLIEEVEVHKVQILDPATGTGTFLAEVVKQIYKKFEGQEGIWSNYVENHLIPRINGFEILMASYSMCHLKLEMLLKETGYKPKNDKTQPRLRVFLTNTLEESHPDTGSLFASWLSNEATEANMVKRDTPVMVILGNPPYSVSSSNKSEWIQHILNDYKKDLNERKLNLDDDYIKFIRFGQHFIDKNNEGILAYISANSFIDGVTHRQMRKHLLESFDKIYILDLHGNAKKKEICLDGSQDQNVFDIMQGVSINLFLKTGSKKKDVLGQVFHIDLRGKRDVKYDYLNTNSIKNINWNKLKCDSPYYFFVPSNNDLILKYEEGFKVNELFTNYNSGVQTKNDSLTVKFDKTDIDDVINNFKNKTKDELENTLKIKDSAGWNIQKAIDDIRNNIGVCVKIQFRLFDIRYTYYTGQSSGFLGRTRDSVMQHMLRDNYSLIFKRTGRVYGGSYDFFFLSKFMISEGLFIIDPLGREYQAPLYLYQKNTDQLDLYDNVERIPNLNIEIINRISESLKLVFKNEKEQNKSTFSPIDILDYIYAILNSLTYRVTYKDFLKIDFPRIPYPNDLNIFWKLIEFGGELRQLHLLESKVLDSYITRYPVDGNNQIIKLNFFDNKVWINDTQYFDDMPKDAWEFYIGGYQPAQKWLKDRKGRTLSYDDIQHYQKIIVALTETDRLMKEIDNVIEI